jgi:hypothetical protein
VIVRYILDANGEPVPCPDPMTWIRWMEDAGAVVLAKDVVGPLEVSTVFLGLDHSHAHAGPPVLWETMIFGADEGHDLHDAQWRYRSRAEALAGHARALELARAAVPGN